MCGEPTGVSLARFRQIVRLIADGARAADATASSPRGAPLPPPSCVAAAVVVAATVRGGGRRRRRSRRGARGGAALLQEKAESKRCLRVFLLALDSHCPVLLRPDDEWGALGDDAAAAEAWCAARFAPVPCL